MSNQVESKYTENKAPTMRAADRSASQQPPPPEMCDWKKRATRSPPNTSACTLGSSFSRSNTSLLAAQARKASTIFQREASMLSNGAYDNAHSSRFELPEFSTISLLTAWGVDCVAALFCLLLCDLYVNETSEFPLTFFLSLGAQLNLLAGIFVYMQGRKMYGARAYRFYQPFVGGVRFVTLQFFGVASVTSSVLLCAAFGLLYDPSESHTRGFLSTVASLALFGNILILLSLRSFVHYSKRTEISAVVAAAGGGEEESHVAVGRSGAAVLAEGGLNGVLRFLCRRPNAESALQVAVLVAQNLLSYVAINFPQLQEAIFVFNFSVTIMCGVLSIFFVSYRKGRGYTGLRLFLSRPWDTVILWVTRLLYMLALFANVLLINASGETVQSSSVLAVQGLNVVSCIAQLLFMRTLHYETLTEMTTLPSSVFELGGVVTVASVFVLACVNVGIFFYAQNFPTGLEEVIEGTSWTYHGVLVFVSQVTQLVSLLPTPLVYMVGVIIHGDRFHILTPQREAATFPVLVMQGLSLLLYIAAVINFVLYLTSSIPTIAVLESNFSVLSVIFMTISVRIYTSVALHQRPFFFAVSRAISGESGQGHADGWHAAAEKISDGAEGVTGATPERSAVFKLASVLPSQKKEALTATATAVAASAGGQPKEFAAVSYIMNGELIISYLLCLTNIMVRLILDVSLHRVWGDVELPFYKLITIGNLCFFTSVPLAHYSAKDKGIRVFHPFSGSGSFVALQVLGWMIYATFVIITVLGTILVLNSDKVPMELVAFMNQNNVFYTLFGVLELLPLLLITFSIVVEAQYTLASNVQQRLAKEAFLEIRRILRGEVENKTEEEKAITQVAFQTLMAAALSSFSLPTSFNMLRLYKEPAAERRARKKLARMYIDNNNDNIDEDDEGEDSTTDSDSIEEESSDGFDSAEDSTNDVVSRQRQQERVRVIIILLCCASAAFFVIAAFTAQLIVLSLAFAVIAMVVTTASCLGVHAGYGTILYGNSTTYSPFMPFRGGTPFVMRQMAGWGCYASAFLVTLISCVESAEVSSTAMAIAAFLSVCSQVFIFSSIPLFSNRRGEPPFLEVNGEGIVAVLTFASAIAFGRVYTSVIALFKADAEQLHYLEDGGTSRRTRVPFVLAVISLSLAVPCTLIALSRTKRQWQRVIRKARSHGKSDGTGSSAEGAGNEKSTSKRGRRAAPKPSPPYTTLTTGVANLLEVLVILLGTVAPVTTLAAIYYFSTHYTPRLVQMVETYTPFCFAVTTLMLLLSMVPYLVNVGVPPFVITVRVTIVTWVLYSLPIVTASVLLLPCMVVPRYSTFFLFGATSLLTLAGNFRNARLMIKLAAYFSIGYITYRKYVFYQSSRHSAFSWLLATRMIGVHTLDCLLLGFWILYIPTYSGKPFHTGAQRSARFTDFARNYLFTDLQRYFDFSVIVDDPNVQMRDGTTQYLFSFHPHGVFPGTALFASLTEVWARTVGINEKTYISTHVASIIFNVPIVRDFNLRLGALSVSRRTLEASLRRGNSAVVVTGGQAEMLHTKVSQTKMTLITQHTGFVKLAISTKVPLVPLLSFAENNVLGLLQFPRIQRITLKILGFPFPMIPYGRFGLPVPFHTRLTMVVGTPVEIPEGADENNPDDVKKLSDAYFKSLKELFYRRRAEAGYPDMELELMNDSEEAAKRKAAAAATVAKEATEVKQ